MLQSAELGRFLSKDDFEKELPQLRAALVETQTRLRELGVGVLILIEGLDGSGRADLLNRLYEWLDPRALEAWTFWAPSDEELERPEMWRYWRALPSKGEIAVHLGGWYRDLLTRAVRKEISEPEMDRALVVRTELERMLLLERVIVLKFFLYIPEAEQKERLKHETPTPDDRWGKKGQKEALQQREKFLKHADRVVRQTDTSFAPWYLVEATDARYRDVTVAKTLVRAVQRFEDVLGNLVAGSQGLLRGGGAPALPDAETAQVTVLDHVDLAQKMSKDEYKKRLADLQGTLRTLVWKAYEKGLSTVIVFEGWDAAGKGGAIRRLASGMDARLYRVVQYGAPTEDERKFPYLWRFWRELPRGGRVLMYDRSWYGRVLVERVEGFASDFAWQRAYREINHFEEQITQQGTVLIKFWLHISPEEQLNRFHERANTSYKQYKITDEDWRNREKWDRYEMAVNEMVFRTGTEYAPWTLVAAEDKNYGRIQILETVCERLARALRE